MTDAGPTSAELVDALRDAVVGMFPPIVHLVTHNDSEESS